jgi:transcriptional regulator with XRE-family HTH domain
MNAIKAIRKHVFGVTQIEFAEIAGVKQSSVSRWEAGVAPTLDEMAAIRRAAVERGLPWSDEFFFTPVADPADEAARSAVEGQPDEAAA